MCVRRELDWSGARTLAVEGYSHNFRQRSQSGLYLTERVRSVCILARNPCIEIRDNQLIFELSIRLIAGELIQDEDGKHAEAHEKRLRERDLRGHKQSLESGS